MDLVQAYAWYSLTVEQHMSLQELLPNGADEARAGIAALEKKLDPAQIAKAKKRAQQWKAAHSF